MPEYLRVIYNMHPYSFLCIIIFWVTTINLVHEYSKCPDGMCNLEHWIKSKCKPVALNTIVDRTRRFYNETAGEWQTEILNYKYELLIEGDTIERPEKYVLITLRSTDKESIIEFMENKHLQFDKESECLVYNLFGRGNNKERRAKKTLPVPDLDQLVKMGHRKPNCVSIVYTVVHWVIMFYSVLIGLDL